LCCGANIDSTLLGRVIESGLASSGRAHVVRLRTRDVPGTLVRIAQVLADTGCNILDIDHHRQGWKVPVGFVEVEILLETRRAGDTQEVDRALAAAGFELR
jgi:threonine dehydratase